MDEGHLMNVGFSCAEHQPIPHVKKTSLPSDFPISEQQKESMLLELLK